MVGWLFVGLKGWACGTPEASTGGQRDWGRKAGRRSDGRVGGWSAGGWAARAAEAQSSGDGRQIGG